MTRVDWTALLGEAAQIVRGYGGKVTLRQLFYRLVSAELLPNTDNYYRSLSRYTAEARRKGTFPALVDRTREIEQLGGYANPYQRVASMASGYRRDRTEGQP